MGRYCWSCGSRRPNERFSRKSGRRGVCRECYRLGPAELAYRQSIRDIDRALRFGATIPHRQRKLVDSFLAHSDPRVREYAGAVVARDREERAEILRFVQEESRQVTMPFAIPPIVDLNGADDWLDDGEDIPF